MGQGVPLAPAGVAVIPNDAELRFKTVSIGLKKLVVRVPDRYDLALSKTIRGYDNDLQVIKEMHDKKPFSLKRLVALFETEMDGAVTKDKRALRLNVAVLVPRPCSATMRARGSPCVGGWPYRKSRTADASRWRALSGLRPTARIRLARGRSGLKKNCCQALDGVLLICSGR